MGVLYNIFSVLNSGEVKDAIAAVSDVTKSNKKRYSSVTRIANEGTLQFPVLVTTSLDIETLQMVNKALERNYASVVQTAISLHPTIDMGKGDGPIEYIKQFHQNSGVKGATSNTMDKISNMIDYESYTKTNNGSIEILCKTYEASYPTIDKINKEQTLDMMDYVRKDILNNKYIPTKESVYNFADKDLSAKHNQILYEDVKAPINDINARALTTEKYKRAVGAAYDPLSKDMLTANDVKKANELVPTLLHTKLRLVNNGENIGLTDFIIGIKAMMHPIKSEEFVTNIVEACKNNDKVFNFIRWTTGEIGFFKDFLFGISSVKADAARKSAGSSSWWLSLKRRKALSNINNINSYAKNRILPNSTLVISIEEANYIKDQYGFDLFKPIFVDKIMSELFLLGFVIVDDATQIVHFFFDGQKHYQAVTFSALETENSNDARKFKEMLKTINRM